MQNFSVIEYSSPDVHVDSPGSEPPPPPPPPEGLVAAASEALWCDREMDIVNTYIDAIFCDLGLPVTAPTDGDGHRHHRECPCGGCLADREDPNPFLDDRTARRRELRRRSDMHSRYRNRVGRGSERDPGPRHYRPGRAPRRAGDRR